MSASTRGLLARYFSGVAVKQLSAVETIPSRSNQHEFNGTEPLRRLLGDSDRRGIATKFIWLSDEQEGVSEDSTISWYDSRRNQPHRSAEFRGYYPSNSVTELMRPGDTLFLALRRDGSCLVVIATAQSTIQNQLLWMFGLDDPELEFQSKDVTDDEAQSDFALRYIFDELGIEPEEPEGAAFDELLARFEGKFPTTRVFSELARKSLPEVSPLDDPDTVLMAWLEREEVLFRRLERKIVAERLASGFSIGDEADVDGFLAFSLSVQNRRKSRAGQSLENHVEEIFKARKISFARGTETENGNRPDFLFPGQAQYRNEAFPSARLAMLGAKSTCKDRWRQVLSEARRIELKHLLTLEPGISENQTNEMRAKSLQLVLPEKLHVTYKGQQRAWLLPLRSFIDHVQRQQAS
jgi:hypothetical protein